MPSYNKVILLGNLTRDPQLKYARDNLPICEFGIAMNRKSRAKDGDEYKSEVCFVDCTAFGRVAETINQYMGLGQLMLLDGRLHYDSWTDAEGRKRNRLTVVVENFQFVEPKKRQDDEPPLARTKPLPEAQPHPDAPTGDDIPF